MTHADYRRTRQGRPSPAAAAAAARERRSAAATCTASSHREHQRRRGVADPRTGNRRAPYSLNSSTARAAPSTRCTLAAAHANVMTTATLLSRHARSFRTLTVSRLSLVRAHTTLPLPTTQPYWHRIAQTVATPLKSVNLSLTPRLSTRTKMTERVRGFQTRARIETTRSAFSTRFEIPRKKNILVA